MLTKIVNSILKMAKLSIFLLLMVNVQSLFAESYSDYTTYQRYNVAGQLTGVISGDPDGSGPLRYAASRNTYNSKGLLTKIEIGELSSWQPSSVKPSSWNGFTIFRYQKFTYDPAGRKTIERTYDVSGVTHAAKQFSYGILNRIKCETVRMNKSSFNSLPSDACQLGAEGSDGPDRITQFAYTSLGQVSTIKKAVGTNIEQTYATYTYNRDLRTSVKDANGNLAQMSYDDFGRMTHWYFPSKTSTGTINSADYEQYKYDANSNRNYVRKRDGQAITYTHDKLDRITLKNISGTANDVYYDYDLRGLQLHARFSSNNGQGITNVYDGFTQLTNSTTNMGGVSRKVSNLYDKKGKRTRITFPDNQYFSYYYDKLDRQTQIRESASTELVNYVYTNKGLPQSQTVQNGAVASLTYDPISRVKSITNNFVGSTQDQSDTFEYAPSSQITKRIIGNQLYAYTGDRDIEGNYDVNGLNQYTAAGGKSFTYDAKGNLTFDGYTTFVYDIENRLLSASGSKNATFKYDPLGRLYQVTSGGVATNFLHQGDVLVAEYNSSGTMLKRYVHGNTNSEAPIVMYEGSGVSSASRNFLHTNYIGSVIAMTNSSGTVSNINKYDTYGIPEETNVGRFGFTGQIYLPELELYYYKARVYSPKLGRFLQVDPVGYADQINLYAYAGNDPMNANDPSGKFLNFIAKFAVDVALNVALQVATGQPIDVGAALKESAMGIFNPAKSLKTAAKIAKALNKSKGSSKTANRIAGKCCFVAGTQVLSKDGFKTIENIKTGDFVWSSNPETGERGWKEVTELFVKTDREIYQVIVETENQTITIGTTDDHPFWVDGEGWKTTIELNPGDQLVTKSGERRTVKSVGNTHKIQITYNFTVADYHTYYVTEQMLLVHNADCDILGNAQKTKVRGKETSHAADSTKAAQEMAASGNFDSVHLNQAVSTITKGNKKSLVRPDAAGINTSTGKVDVVEILSGKQTAEQMTKKITKALGDSAGKITCIKQSSCN